MWGMFGLTSPSVELVMGWCPCGGHLGGLHMMPVSPPVGLHMDATIIVVNPMAITI